VEERLAQAIAHRPPRFTIDWRHAPGSGLAACGLRPRRKWWAAPSGVTAQRGQP
jgi:hypothetical protein